MKIVGLVGGVACGKSKITTTLRELGACAIHGDPVTHKVLNYPEVMDMLFARWVGKIFPVLSPPQQIGPETRRRIAEHVFRNPEELEFLEEITGPLIIEEIRRSMSLYSEKWTTMLVLDVPMLFELGFEHDCDAIWYVQTPEHQRLDNFKDRYNVGGVWYTDKQLEDNFRSREQRLDLEFRKSKATAIIENYFGAYHRTEGQLKGLYEALLQ